MRIPRRTERTIVRAMCEVQLNDMKKAEDLKLVWGFIKTVYQLAKALDFQIECLGRKPRLKRT